MYISVEKIYSKDQQFILLFMINIISIEYKKKKKNVLCVLKINI